MDSQQIADALRGAAPDGAVEPFAAADGMPTIYVAREHAPAVTRIVAREFQPQPPIGTGDENGWHAA